MTKRKVLRGTRAALAAVHGKLNRRTIAEQLLTVSGANRDVLRDAPKERTKQVAMGAVLVSTAAIAAVSATYALHLALHLPVPFAGVAGLAWGLIILNLDRWLVVSTPRLNTKWGTLMMALPRVLLAILIGAVISTPLTLAVFSAEINTEVKVMAAEAENDFNKKLAADSRFEPLSDLRQQIAYLQADLQDGVTDDDVLKDPAVVDLQQRVDEAKTRYEAAAAAVQCENDGTCGTGVPGIGDVSREKIAERNRLQTEWEGLQQQLNDVEVQVRGQLEAEDAKKSADQQVQLAKLQKEVADTQRAKDEEIAAHKAAVGESDGILARLTALGRIQDRAPLLGTAHVLLFLFMTALECLPIIFKTMLSLGPPSLYERLAALDEERVEARVRLRMQTEYEEAETLARSALAAAEARAARTLEAESKATGLVLNAQLAVTREGVRRWRDEQFGQTAADGETGAANIAAETVPDARSASAEDIDAAFADELEELEGDLARPATH